MHFPDAIASRLIGSLFVERGLVSESQIRVALEIQRETGAQLGQILVDQFGVSRKELTRVVAEQWRAMHGGDPGAGPDAAPGESWRPLGEIFLTRGFVSEDELDAALSRQRKTGERLGEALVALGVISKFELAGALGEQMATLEAAEAESVGAEGNVVSLHSRSADDEPHVDVEQEPTPALVDDAGDQHADAATDDVVEEAPDEGEPVFAREPSIEIRSAFESLPSFEPYATSEPEPTPEEEPTIEMQPTDEGEPSFPMHDDVFDPAESEPAGYEIAAEAEPEDMTRFDDAVDEWLVPPREPETEDVTRVDDAVDEWLVPPQAPEPEPVAARYVAYASTPWGYRLVPLDVELPSVGDTLDVPDVGELVVSRVGRSPLPGDTRLCVFAEQRLVPAAR